MKERLRAPLAAAIALLIGGDLAARGPGALLDAGRFLFPYLWLFLAFEALRRRRRLLDEEAFLLGAAVGLAHDGIFTKVLQDGGFFLNLNALSALTSCLDWGMIVVVSLHAADALLPRPAEPVDEDRAPETAALVFLPAVAFFFYLYGGFLRVARYERALSSAWPLTDLIFAAAAAALVRRALSRASADEPEPRDRGLWALAVFCAWLPGARLAARVGGAEWTSLGSLFLLVSWTGLFGFYVRRLWLARGAVGPEPVRSSRPILALAGWRLAGAVLLLLIFGSMDYDARVAPSFSFLVDLPTRLLFLSIFFSRRLAV